MEADLAIVALLVVSFLVGVFRGPLRQLVALGAWLVTFILAAHLRPPLADWLAAQAAQFARPYVEMLAFLLAYLVLFGIALAVIEIGGRTIELSSRPLVDDVLGGALMFGVGLLAVAGLLVALSTYYGADPPAGAAEVGVVHTVNEALEHSAIARALRDSLVPGLQALLGPLLPADVRFAG